MENKIIELLRKNRIGKEKAVYLAHELLFLLGAVERSEQLVCENCGDVAVRDEGDWCDKCLNEGF